MPGSIVAKGLFKGYSTRTGFLPVVDGIDLSVAEGEFVALVGPSGCGKSTLLDVLSGFEKPDRGEVTADGRRVTGPSRRRILIPQTTSVFPWLTSSHNLTFVKNGLSPDETARRTEHYLEMVGLKDFQSAFPYELSGGMLKRLEMARALSVKPDILFMDEAFGSLDALTRLRLRTDLLRLLSVERHTVLLVTHDVEEAVHVADRVIILTSRPARIQRIVEIPHPHPRSLANVELIQLKREILADLGVEID